MQFRDLGTQYQKLKEEIDSAVLQVMKDTNFISGKQVNQLEKELAEYTGTKHCITCANGTDALTLALMVWNIGKGDAVFIPDFTFFSTGEVVAYEGAVPIFVDVDKDTFNISPNSLQNAIETVIKENKLKPKAIITVDLFGQPADYSRIIPIAEKYNLKLLEDCAQGFGGAIGGRRACSFGDIATTSFFPAKPLGCYGDGGAIFTNDDEVAALLRSLTVHGKGEDKYDNVRIGMNSRLDTIQAAVLLIKLKALKEYELAAVNNVADWYERELHSVVITPKVLPEFYSSWAQYTIVLDNREQRDGLQAYLKSQSIPSMIYYQKPMHLQKAFVGENVKVTDLSITEELCNCVLSLPMHPYMSNEDVILISNHIKNFFNLK